MTAEAFSTIEKFCLFIGYPRSGHSLVGSLLDAHQEAIIAHEADVLKYLGEGMDNQALFELLLENSRDYANNGRAWSGYNYSIQNQSQGRFEKLKVIGDKKGGRSTLRILENPQLLELLYERFGSKLRLIHVVRNPFDNIATRVLRRYNSKGRMITAEGMENEINKHFHSVRINEAIRKDGRFKVLDIRSEDLISDPKANLKKVCEFVGLEASEKYLEDCASIVFAKPSESRFNAPWQPYMIKNVLERVSKYDFLKDYSFVPRSEP